MFKGLVEAHLRDKLKSIDKEVEEISSEYYTDFIGKSTIQKYTNILDKDLERKILILQSKVTLYNIIFNIFNKTNLKEK